MKKLENLPEITDRALDGLRADDTLKTKIINAVLHDEKPIRVGKPLRFISVLLASLSVMLLCVFLLNGKKPLLPEEEKDLIRSFSAGNSSASSVSFDTFTETAPDTIKSIELLTSGTLSGSDLVNQLVELLKCNSVSVTDPDIVMNDQLNIFDSTGMLFSLQAEAPYIKWSDGVRKCEPFFELFGRYSD